MPKRPRWSVVDAGVAADIIEMQLADSYGNDGDHIKLLAHIVADLCREVAVLKEIAAKKKGGSK